MHACHDPKINILAMTTCAYNRKLVQIGSSCFEWRSTICRCQQFHEGF